MKTAFTLWGSLALSLLLAPLTGYSQTCSNQITVSYYDNGVLKSTTVNNGQSGSGAAVCPTAGAQYTFSAVSTSNAVLSWERVISRAARSENDVVAPVTSATAPAGAVLEATVSFTTTTEFRIRSNADVYPSSSCNKDGFLYMTFRPALTLASSGTSASAGVCSGAGVTLTAAGATGDYTWRANGAIIPNQTSGTLTVTPTVTTTYLVSATTDCGTSSQQVTIPVKDVTVTPSAPFICANQPTMISATYNGTSATYQWFVKGQPGAISLGSSATVTPAVTTTYQVVATTSDCSTITKEVVVTVGPAGLRVAPTAATICAGGSIDLQGTSDNPAATYAWSPSTGLSATTGATVTASPSATTTYTVTATTPCGDVTASQVEVVVVPAPTYSVTPSAPAICAGDAVALTASSGITNTAYRWYRTSDLGTLLSTAATLTVAPSTTTTYRVLTTSPCGATNTQDVTVTVGSRPVVAVSPTAATIAVGGSTTLTASGASTYSWTATTGGVTTNLAATTASITVSPAYTTTYAATGSVGSCSNTAQATVAVSRPLPVELVDFLAIWSGNGAQLSWATASEKNNAYFVVERSFDGKTFTEIGKREGTGTTSARSTYQFNDAGLSRSAAATAYYRLRQVDTNGEYRHSPVRTVSIGAASAALKATVFPNPYGDGVNATVRLHAAGTDAITLTVRNVLGQTMHTETITRTAGVHDVELPRANAWPAGVYYLTVGQGGQQQVLSLSHR
ncbi:MAG TPA: T9SS type A sorting domain-containing protein [Hymenobacter sp.]|jgi:hypothetical protein|uniref:T9SS type A sorting domain-containing protein n=1 Tax=Hymenobacter sp. TaxID=1898978 RepID=UPI002EDA28E4